MELQLHTSEWNAEQTILGFPVEHDSGHWSAGSLDGALQPLTEVERLRMLATQGDFRVPSARAADQDRRTADLTPRDRSELANRALNVAVAVVAIVILAPIMLMIAIMVKLTSPGPVFYVQTRVGLDRRRRSGTAPVDRRQSDVGGRTFNMIKFRSMRPDAEQGTGAVWATRNDPRITPIGHFLRKTRLDELPQLFNVIMGDMNIVGPRPERPSIFAQLRENIDAYPLRQRARPGITGWAQINQAYDTSIEDVRSKVQLDLEYLQRQSVVEDLKIMVRTLPVMIFKRGAN